VLAHRNERQQTINLWEPSNTVREDDVMKSSRVRSVVGSNELDLAPRVVIGNQEVQSSHNLSELCSESVPHLLLRTQYSLIAHYFRQV